MTAKTVSTDVAKKITFKAICGTPSQADIKEAIKNDRTQLPQTMQIVGICNGTKITTNSDTGETYEALSGDFVAFDTRKPEQRTNAALAYLPPIAFELIKGKLGGDNQIVEFALLIGTRLPNDGEKSPAGYIYMVKPLIEPQETDPLQKLLAKVEASQKALPKAEK